MQGKVSDSDTEHRIVDLTIAIAIEIENIIVSNIAEQRERREGKKKESEAKNESFRWNCLFNFKI